MSGTHPDLSESCYQPSGNADRKPQYGKFYNTENQFAYQRDFWRKEELKETIGHTTKGNGNIV